ncbi:MAG TPA: HDOD domain-containing protein, partial [Woeseiaceae bacterium]|nr:HDOD domain-containing protein [Woeseiaceae bacterium]
KTEPAGPATRLAESIAVLPPLPVTAQKILTCFGDEFIDADKVAEVVEGDPGICAKLLGLANSAYFGLAEPLYKIREAISRVLGVDTVRSLVLAMAIQQSFNSKDCPGFKVERFWVDSLKVAECCKKIAAMDDAAPDADRDLAYTTGLCFNLGLMALAHMEPQRSDKVLRKAVAEPGTGALTRLLAEAFDTDHRFLTAELARAWSLPEPMLAAYQCRALGDAQCSSRLGLILRASVAAVENSTVQLEDRESLEEYARPLGLNDEDLQDVADISERQEERVLSLASNMTR